MGKSKSAINYVIDFPDNAIYRIIAQGKQLLPGALTDNQIMTTDQNILDYAAVIKATDRVLYMPFSIEAVLTGTLSVDTIKGQYHYILLGNRLDVVAKLVKFTDVAFEFSVRGYITIHAKRFGLGDPYD